MALLIVFLSLLAFATADGPCASGQSYFAPANKCFYYNSTYMLWPDARSFCQSKGGDIITIHSQAEDDFISNIMDAGNMTWIWLGMNVSMDDIWLEENWIDGSPINYTAWFMSGNCGYNSDHAQKNKKLYYEWYCTDKGSGETFGVVCQTKPPPVPICPNGATYNAQTNRCYLVNKNELSWKDAHTNCKSSGGDLVSIHSADENSYVTIQAGKYADVYWTGYNRVLTQTYNYTWSDGTPVNYTNWNSDLGVPGSCMHGAQDCASVATSNGNWYNCWTCDQALASVCAIPPQAPTTLPSEEIIRTHPKQLNKKDCSLLNIKC